MNRCHALSLAVALTLSVAGSPAFAEDAPPAATMPAEKPAAPARLPGNGLAQHDFFYAGEVKAQNMYIVRKGEIVWRHEVSTGKGEISDATLMSNGNILFAHQFGVTIISPDEKVIWNDDAPPKTEIHTAVPIGKEHVLFIRNGDPAKAFVMNIVTGQTEREFELPVRNPKATHGQFRHARLTAAGTLLVAHMDLGKVCEYDDTGKQLSSMDLPGVWAAERLANGNILACAGRSVLEISPAGQNVWQFTPADIPDYKVAQFQIATRLANGNTLVNNWVNQWNGAIDPASAPAQAWEVTPDKSLVWALRSWQGGANLGPATTIQLLDEPGAAEDAHFGPIK